MTSRGYKRLGRRFLLVVILAVVVVLVDQVSKRLISARLSASGVQLLGNVLRLDYTRNTGAAFGLFASGGAALAIVALVVIAVILFSYRRLAEAHWIVRTGLGLIAGGASGNLIDRVRLGYVVDFVHLGWWPVFNLADSAISIGAVMLVLHSFRRAEAEVRT